MQNVFLKPNDPLLRQFSTLVPRSKLKSKEVTSDIETMLSVAYGEQTDRKKPLLVGLAAPQIGILKRIILVDIKADGKGIIGDLRVYINPEIILKPDETEEWYEGCFSTDRVCGIVSRSIEIKLKALTQDGKEVMEIHSGYTARIFQHEIDHLNGREFVSHITDDDKLHWVEEDEFPEYRNNGRWRTWAKKCSREKWEEIKRPK